MSKKVVLVTERCDRCGGSDPDGLCWAFASAGKRLCTLCLDHAREFLWPTPEHQAVRDLGEALRALEPLRERWEVASEACAVPVWTALHAAGVLLEQVRDLLQRQLNDQGENG